MQCDKTSGESLCEDRHAPTISAVKTIPSVLEAGVETLDASYMLCSDTYDGDFAPSVDWPSAVKLGTVNVMFVCRDSAGLSSNARVSVEVVDRIAPVLELVGSAYVSVLQYETYEDAGYTVSDAGDAEIASRVVVVPSTVDTSLAQTVVVQYSVADVSRNKANPVERRVFVASLSAENKALTSAMATYTRVAEEEGVSSVGAVDIDASSLAAKAYLQAYRSAGGNLSDADALVRLSVSVEKAREDDAAASSGSSSGDGASMSSGLVIGFGIMLLLLIVLVAVLVTLRCKAQPAVV